MPKTSTSASPIIGALHKYREKYFAEARAAATDEAQKRADEVLVGAGPGPDDEVPALAASVIGDSNG